MRAPEINLSRRPFRNNTVYWTVFISCTVILLIASIFNIRDYVTRGTELSILQDQTTEARHRHEELRVEVERMKQDVRDVNLSLLDQKSAFVNGLIVSRFFSWSHLFDQLEEVIPYDVKIRSIRPSISAQMIELQIDGMAKTAAALYEFEARLSESDYFSSVYPVSENTRESRNEINFDLVMNYVPAGKSGTEPSPPTPTAGLPSSVEEDAGEEEGTAEGDVEAGPAVAEVDPDSVNSGESHEDIDQEAGSSPETTMVATDEAEAPAVTALPGIGDSTPGGPQGAREGTPPAVGDPPSPSAVVTSDQFNRPPAAGSGSSAGGVQKSNRQLLELLGEERYRQLFGAMVPREASERSELTNAEFIDQLGIEKFLEVRGDLTFAQQVRKEDQP